MTSKLCKTEFDVNIPRETMLTPNAIAQIVIQILKMLLFQRNQIPLVYNTLKFFISKWNDTGNHFLSEDLGERRNFEFHRHRLNVMTTFNEMEEFFNIIMKIFNIKKVIKSVRILLGPTTFTPKEVYTINIPPIFYDHYDESHVHTIDTVTKTFLRSILLSEKLGQTFLNPLRPTNIYMDFELESSKEFVNEHLNTKEICEFTATCKQIVINIRPMEEHLANFICCRKLKVFEEVNKTTHSHGDEKSGNHCFLSFRWYEMNQVIKGFSDSKKFNIWIPE